MVVVGWGGWVGWGVSRWGWVVVVGCDGKCTGELLTGRHSVHDSDPKAEPAAAFDAVWRGFTSRVPL